MIWSFLDSEEGFTLIMVILILILLIAEILTEN